MKLEKTLHMFFLGEQLDLNFSIFPSPFYASEVTLGRLGRLACGWLAIF